MTKTTIVYTDHRGDEITVGEGLLTACTPGGTVLSIPLDADQLAALGAALIERSITEKHGEVSERAGAVLGGDLVRELLALRGQPQAKAFCALRDKLHALSKLECADSAAAGFAGAIVNVLELGIANLPKLEKEAAQ